MWINNWRVELIKCFFFCCRQETADDAMPGLVGSEMGRRDGVSRKKVSTPRMFVSTPMMLVSRKKVSNR